MTLSEEIEYRCFACGRKFKSLGDMQVHVVVEHLQMAGYAEKIADSSDGKEARMTA